MQTSELIARLLRWERRTYEWGLLLTPWLLGRIIAALRAGGGA